TRQERLERTARQREAASTLPSSWLAVQSTTRSETSIESRTPSGTKAASGFSMRLAPVAFRAARDSGSRPLAEWIVAVESLSPVSRKGVPGSSRRSARPTFPAPTRWIVGEEPDEAKASSGPPGPLVRDETVGGTLVRGIIVV